MNTKTMSLCSRCVRECALRSERIQYCDSFTRADGLGIREELASIRDREGMAPERVNRLPS